MMEISNIDNQQRTTGMPVIGLRLLRFAVVANDCGSLRQAAELLSIPHSVVSRSIGQLERLVGTSLFERSTAGVQPTLAGKVVVRIARMVLEQVDTLVATGRSIGRGETGHLSVGFCTSISAGNLRTTLLDFRTRFPRIELAIAERPRTLLMNALRSGTLDVLIVTSDTPSSDNKTLRVWSERVLVALPEDHPLAARDAVYWTDLRDETVLLSHHDSSREFEDLIISKFVSTDDRPKIDRHDVSRSMIRSLVSMKLGVSLIMESDMGASFAGLKYRELRDGTGSSHIGFSAHWCADNENPALNRFLELLAERYSSPSPGD